MFTAEMKKIWTFRTVLVIVIFSILFFFSFLFQWIKPFRWEGDSLSVRLDILSDWIARYGNTIDQAEFGEIEDGYNNVLYQARSVIGENGYFEENGVEDYGGYLDYEQKAINGYEGHDYSVYSKMRSLLAENTGYSRIWFQEYENVMQKYREYGEEKNSILPFEVFVYTSNYLMYLAIWCLVCVFFIAAPVMVNDRENNIVAAQYSSRIGKKAYRMQYACTMFSAFIVSVLLQSSGFWHGELREHSCLQGLICPRSSIQKLLQSQLLMGNMSCFLLLWSTCWHLELAAFCLACLHTART